MPLLWKKLPRWPCKRSGPTRRRSPFREYFTKNTSFVSMAAPPTTGKN